MWWCVVCVLECNQVVCCGCFVGWYIVVRVLACAPHPPCRYTTHTPLYTSPPHISHSILQGTLHLCDDGNTLNLTPLTALSSLTKLTLDILSDRHSVLQHVLRMLWQPCLTVLTVHGIVSGVLPGVGGGVGVGGVVCRRGMYTNDRVYDDSKMMYNTMHNDNSSNMYSNNNTAMTTRSTIPTARFEHLDMPWLLLAAHTPACTLNPTPPSSPPPHHVDATYSPHTPHPPPTLTPPIDLVLGWRSMGWHTPPPSLTMLRTLCVTCDLGPHEAAAVMRMAAVLPCLSELVVDAWPAVVLCDGYVGELGGGGGDVQDDVHDDVDGNGGQHGGQHDDALDGVMASTHEEQHNHAHALVNTMQQHVDHANTSDAEGVGDADDDVGDEDIVSAHEAQSFGRILVLDQRVDRDDVDHHGLYQGDTVPVMLVHVETCVCEACQHCGTLYTEV